MLSKNIFLRGLSGADISTSRLKTHPKKSAILAVLSGNTAQGLTIREISEICGESVYSVRHWLLIMEQEGSARRECKGKSAHWLKIV